MARNEFRAGDRNFSIKELSEMTDLQLQDMLKEGRITHRDVALARNKNHPGKGEDEDLSQEVSPVEEDPHMWPSETRHSLADLRKSPGASTTEAHIAERYGAEDTPLR